MTPENSDSAHSARPNIVLIIAHDLGQHLGCYGVATVRSPHLDSLAARGARFSNSFCAAPGCSPSRAALFTGRAPHCNGVLGLTHPPFSFDLHADERHLAAILHDAGYSTALFGLQHETRRPGEMGFDTIELGAPETPGASPYRCERTATQVAAYFASQNPSPNDSKPPFYAQIGFFEPHRDPASPEQFGPMPPDAKLGVQIPAYLVDDEAARREFAAYQGAIAVMDGAVGQILASLDANGLSENTLILFTTDHGIPFPRAKCSVYDAGIETALLMGFPRGDWPQNQVFEPMISNIDILPTLLDLVGLETPQNVQGRSFLPLLRGEKDAPRDEIFAEMTYHDYYDPMRCIRTRTHKLIASFCPNNIYMDPHQQRQPRVTACGLTGINLPRHPLIELFDLRDDPHEMRNLAGDAAHQTVKNQLLARLGAWMRETQDPLLRGVPPSPMHGLALEQLGLEQLLQA